VDGEIGIGLKRDVGAVVEANLRAAFVAGANRVAAIEFRAPREGPRLAVPACDCHALRGEIDPASRSANLAAECSRDKSQQYTAAVESERCRTEHARAP